ncbi:hypothetical protein MGG_18008 [Pyricularia oryzae 70-15]|uniref:Uncharacterized protein n=1 Tax=Pyricularia oryzae (strain 70-15 / ATCC MYA-4617 / FGSC 8958) TaxID=242507 RepID=G4NJI9_PYRO7|nr:uncharacterized protein MGG_18008 [Pyricularia oryzae 70-15]EHA46405.1 hypothetical protein MGG_18008 [Pyricularia oryzae 70-15]
MYRRNGSALASSSEAARRSASLRGTLHTNRGPVVVVMPMGWDDPELGACLLLFMPSGAAHALRQSKAVSFGSPISSPYPTALSPPEHLLKTVHMMTIADADVLNPDLTVAQRPGI